MGCSNCAIPLALALLVCLVPPSHGQPFVRRGIGSGLQSPMNAPQMPDAETVRGLPSACDCTELGLSGNADVGGRVGCGQHLLEAYADPTYFCYVVDPNNCPAASSSEQFLGAGFRGCNPEVDLSIADAAGVNRTLQEIIMNVPSLTIFSQALDQANLLELLQSPDGSGLTIFAPSDDAFEAMFEALDLNATRLLESDRLLTLLLSHIGLGIFSQTSFPTRSFVEVPTASPSAFNTIQVGAGTRILTSLFEPSRVIRVIDINEPVYDPETSTGVSSGTFGFRQFAAYDGMLHVVSAVLAPLEDVASALQQTPSFSTFFQAMQATGVADMIGADCPSPETADCQFNPITVFAPTNSAFQNLAMALNLTVSELLELPQLEEIVLFHITDPSMVTSPILLDNLEAGESLATLSGANITVGSNTTFVPAGFDPVVGVLFRQQQELVLGSPSPLSQPASFASPTTIKAYNGVIHPISEVLLPPEVEGGLVVEGLGPEGEAPTGEPTQY